ncbi:MAG: ferrochelatase [Gordonia sp.]|uniref:ferrochelatase n=1 Tax=Gordonia sp. (in: high G+C Gram-positive bacteria) TaxID=84139 RepID=UPI001DCE792B|nr:ferrochelatase [Gordonia sp. (in: high G+C Gram-positive bacteria)]MCB1294303.1 ferrochelatase [Gordonia sp. (in: high G+C Gram-positive bacteria)]
MKPFDALLFLSFGGPEKPDDVMPFLENVTRGRGVPRERLEAVAQHYLHFGGVSPINQCNRDMIAALRAELSARGRDLPVYFGNRNWHPLVADTVEQMYRDGHRRVLVFGTSAWGGYSGSVQYHEDIAGALLELSRRIPQAADDPMLLRKLPQFCTEPAFLDACASAVRRAIDSLPADPAPRLVFTAHSIPLAADRRFGPVIDGRGIYSRQIADACAAVAQRLGITDYDQVWQSRSGPPQVPWYEPDICDHLDTLADNGTESVVVFPIGFISDHLEVVWDLDNEAKTLCSERGLGFARAATVGTDPTFISLVADLTDRYADGAGNLAAPGVGDNGTGS